MTPRDGHRTGRADRPNRPPTSDRPSRRSGVGILPFLAALRWLDGSPLLDHVEPYRRRLFTEAFDTFDETGRPRYNLILTGRAKKNWKSADLVIAALYALCANESPQG